ncbi:MAG: ABC transporter ATP-binding protein [Micromonosporaceae bacterium]|jgi:ABC-2 type transport system ATP-binding protein
MAAEVTMGPAIRTFGLTKRFGRRTALADLDLEVPEGVIFGYLGPNGAGKTTTIRLLAGLLRPTRGHATVLGRDVVRDRQAAQQQIGYLPGEFVAYPDLTVEAYLRYFAHLHGDADLSWAARLAERLDLDMSRRIGALSHGNRQKVGIVRAFLTRPRVLILDEPTAGLDPLVQREFLALLRETRDAGNTVFLSSHVLSEVEAVADQVGILRQGRLVEVRSVTDLKARALRQIQLTFEDEVPVERIRAAAGVRDVRVDGQRVQLVVEGSTAELLAVAAPYRVTEIATREPDLEEIFLSYYGQG